MIVTPADATAYETHGSTFISFVAPAIGSTQLCAWRLEVPPNCVGTAHRPDREEVVLLLEGRLRITIDGVASVLACGDVALFPAGSEIRIDTGGTPASAWVTTTTGLRATMADGTTIAPPWAN